MAGGRALTTLGACALVVALLAAVWLLDADTSRDRVSDAQASATRPALDAAPPTAVDVTARSTGDGDGDHARATPAGATTPANVTTPASATTPAPPASAQPVELAAPDVAPAPRTARIVVRSNVDGRVLPDAELQAFVFDGRWEGYGSEASRSMQSLALNGPRAPVGITLLLHAAAPGHSRQAVWIGHATLVADGEHEIRLDPAPASRLHFVDDTGAPVPDVEVRVFPSDRAWYDDRRVGDLRHEFRSDADGVVRLDECARGHVGFLASKPGHASAQEDVELTADDATWRYVLRRRASLDLRVLTPGGTPAADVEVLVARDKHTFLRGRSVTDRAGQLFFEELPAVPLVVHAEGAPPADIELLPGEHHELVLRQRAPFVLEGRLTAGGRPLERFQISAIGQYGNERAPHARFDTLTDADGNYRLEVGFDGPFALSMFQPGRSVYRGEHVAHAGATERFDVDVPRGWIVGGVVFTDRKAQQVSFDVLDASGAEVMEAGLRSGDVWRAGPLPPGNYSVRVSGHKVVTAQHGPYEVEVGLSTEAGELPLELAGDLRGPVTHADGRPFQGDFVLRRVDDPSVERRESTRSGTFFTLGLRPGEWDLQLLGPERDGVSPVLHEQRLHVEPGVDCTPEVVIADG